MRKSLQNLIDDLYNDEQKEMAETIALETEIKGIIDSRNHLLNYMVLSIPIDEKLTKRMNEKEAEEFYGTSAKNLTKVDYVVGDMLIELSKNTGRDIGAEFDEATHLDTNQPEFEFLVKTVREVMMTEKQGESK